MARETGDETLGEPCRGNSRERHDETRGDGGNHGRPVGIRSAEKSLDKLLRREDRDDVSKGMERLESVVAGDQRGSGCPCGAQHSIIARVEPIAHRNGLAGPESSEP